MREPSPRELHGIREAVREVLTCAKQEFDLNSPSQVIVAHYIGGTPAPGTPWPCMDAVLVLCDHSEATALVAAIIGAVRDLGGDVHEGM